MCVPRILGLEKKLCLWQKIGKAQRTKSDVKVNYNLLEVVSFLMIFFVYTKVFDLNILLKKTKLRILHSVLQSPWGHRLPIAPRLQYEQKRPERFFSFLQSLSFSFKKAKEMRTMCMTITTTHAYPIE